MGTPKTQFQITATPDPNAEAFYTDLDQEVLSQLRQSEWPRTSDGGNTATVYQDWIQHLPERVTAGYGNYLYVRKVGLGGGEVRFYWSANKTQEQKDTPFRETTTFGNHYWPPILLGVDIQKSRMPRAVNGGNVIYRGAKYEGTPIWIPNADTGTKFVLKDYFAADKFDIPKYPTPITAPVSFPLPGSDPFNFPESLHGDITIPALQDELSTYNLGTSQVLNVVGSTSGWFIPHTNFETWKPYVLYDRQSEVEVGWHRQQMWVFPPALPKAQRVIR